MTTCAYQDGILAADTQASADGALSYMSKLYQVKDAIIAISGCPYNATKFVRWYGNRRSPKPDTDADAYFECIVLTPDVVEIWTPALSPIEPLGDFCAIGSGQAAAMAAMTMGASAIQAVEIAMLYDADTGGQVQWLEIEPRGKDVEWTPSPALRLQTGATD